MPTVKVITSDGQIWNRDDVILLISKFLGHGVITLDLLREGPCCESSGIDALLDKFESHVDNFVIETSNQISSSKYLERRFGFVELEYSQNLANKTDPIPSTLEKIFSIFIGRSNWQRLGLASHLWNYYKDISTINYHFDPSSDYHKDNFGLERYLYHNWNDRDIWKFLQNVPMIVDQRQYPILWNQGAFELQKQYRDIFCEIVCETYFTGRTFFITEKTWRPIINRRPFIVQGPRWYLENLRRLGFRTFDQWWDEGYDEDPSDARLDTLRANIDWIASQDRSVIKRWYEEMQPTLEQNLETLKNLTQEKISDTVYKHD